MNTHQSPDAASLTRLHSASVFILFVVSLAVFITAGDLMLQFVFNDFAFNPEGLIR